MRSIVLLVIVTMLTAGCARYREIREQQAATPRGPVTAHDAGCSSGYASAGNPWYRFTKDTEQYITDARYKSDWDDGFVQCKGSMDAVNSVPLR